MRSKGTFTDSEECGLTEMPYKRPSALSGNCPCPRGLAWGDLPCGGSGALMVSSPLVWLPPAGLDAGEAAAQGHRSERPGLGEACTKHVSGPP